MSGSRRTGVGISPARCHCGLPPSYAGCCAPYVEGVTWPRTAVALMRSRYAGFVVGDADWLLASWHPDTRPPSIDLDAAVHWVGLTIQASTAGGFFDDTATVTFAAHYSRRGRNETLREHSVFRRFAGRWSYVGPVGPGLGT